MEEFLNDICTESLVKLADYGLNEEILRRRENKDLLIGRIITQNRNYYKVITEKGEIIGRVSGKMKYNLENKEDFPSVGEWVEVEYIEKENSIIHKVVERKTLLYRKVAGVRCEEQVIAANVDKVFITMSLNNNFNIRRIERYINIAWDSGATPIILLTKADISQDLEEKLDMVMSVALGIDVIVVSAFTGIGFDRVKDVIKHGDTVVFVGSSGVGKSTIINKLIGEDIQETKDVDGMDKGRHTTTSRELFLIEGGGVVIDTPGMRELQIISGDMENTFSDIEELSCYCRFHDCMHVSEPGCAVKKAIDEGTLDEDRLKNYMRLKREIKNQEIRRSQKERQNQRKHNKK